MVIKQLKYPLLCCKLTLAIGLLIITASSFANPVGIHHHRKGEMTPPVIVVSTMAVKKAMWQNKVTVVGTTIAAQGITISSSQAGIISDISFRSGQRVKKGQQLLQQQNSDLVAIVAQDQAKLNYAQDQYQRSQQLLAKGLVSRNDQLLDQNKSNVTQAQAQLAEDQAILNKTIIRAPFSGRLGIRQVNLGQYLESGQSIVELQQLSPILVDANVPQNQLSGVKIGDAITVTVARYPKIVFTGRIQSMGASLDPSTHSLPIRALLSNKDGKLLAGMYVNVNILLAQKRAVIIVPQTAISYQSYGASVFIIEKGKAILRYVQTGKRYHNSVIITQGLKLGDAVVVAGQNKLHDGVSVAIDNRIKAVD